MVGCWWLWGAAAQEIPLPPEAPVVAPVLVPPSPVAPLAPAWPAERVPGRDEAAVEVELLLLVDERGALESVEVLRGEEPFVSAAMASLQGARFTPATEDGVPVSVEVPLLLRLEPPPLVVSGHVRDPAGAPLSGATVRLGDRTDVTGPEGEFGFRALGAGTATLVVEAPGHVFSPVPVTVDPAEHLEVELREAGPKAPSDEGIVGIYQRERVEVTARSISEEDLRSTPGTMGDPLRAIANLPGAVRTPLDAGWLLIRGGYPDDTAVYFDGVRVPLVYHLGGFTSVIHPALIEEVKLFPGGQSARYGRATAGAVDVLTRDAPATLDARVGINIIHAGAYLGVPLPEGGLVVAGRRSYLDVVLGAVPGITEAQAGVAPRFYDGEAKWSWRDVSATFFGYADTIDASDTAGTTLEISLGTQRLHGAGRLALPGDRTLLVQPWFARESRVLTVDAVDLAASAEGLGGGLRVESRDPGFGPLGWSAGVDATLKHTRLQVNEVARALWLASPEPYADLRFGEDRSLVLGLRGDTLFAGRQQPRLGLSPRVAATWPVTPAFRLTADVGMTRQPPPESLVVGPPVGETLQLARAWSGGVGTALERGPVRFEGGAFVRRTWDVTAYELDGSIGQGEALAWGIESQTRFDLPRLRGWLTASYTRSLRREEPEYAWSPAVYDQPLSLVLIGMYDLGRGWTLGGRARYATGFPVPPQNNPVALDVLTQTNVPLIAGADGRLEDFHALDLKISRHVEGRTFRLDAYLDIQNVYNHRIPEPAISGFPELTSEYVYGFGLPILPILGVEIGFRAPTATRTRTPATPREGKERLPPPPPPAPPWPPPEPWW